MKKRGHKTEVIVEVILKCKRLEYINESLMADRFIAERKRRYYGPHHIKQNLRKKGVSEQDIATALKRNYPHEEELRIGLLAAEKKEQQLKGKSGSNAHKQKIYAHLLYRGFSPEVIQQVLTCSRPE